MWWYHRESVRQGQQTSTHTLVVVGLPRVTGVFGSSGVVDGPYPLIWHFNCDSHHPLNDSLNWDSELSQDQPFVQTLENTLDRDLGRIARQCGWMRGTERAG